MTRDEFWDYVLIGSTNMKRMLPFDATKTTCPRGHPYDRVWSGKRRCSVCSRESSKRSYYKRNGR